ncbi:MAG TPA: hypothetical protein ENL27_00310 [Candidatus Parcubacteria bacterium]|nr:hypothetical protein [Candidatus Parcubacteria bacterium]
MRNFLRKYNRFDRLVIKIVLAGVVGVLIAGAVFYFWHLRGIFEGGGWSGTEEWVVSEEKDCSKLPALADV